MSQNLLKRIKIRKKRTMRIRKKLRGSSARPRLSVSKSLCHIGVQIIDDEKGVTITSFSTLSKEAKNIKNFRIDGKYYYFETSGKGITKFNWIDKEKLVLTKQIVTFSEENYKIEKRFEDFQIIDGIIFPRIIHFISDEIGGSISMEYIDSRFNISEEIIP